MSRRVPKHYPSRGTGSATGMKISSGNEPGGSPMITQVPVWRVIAKSCLNAGSEGAVISTP